MAKVASFLVFALVVLFIVRYVLPIAFSYAFHYGGIAGMIALACVVYGGWWFTRD